MELHNDCSFTSCSVYWNQDLFVSLFCSGSNLLLKFFLVASVGTTTSMFRKKDNKGISATERFDSIRFPTKSAASTGSSLHAQWPSPFLLLSYSL